MEASDSKTWENGVVRMGLKNTFIILLLVAIVLVLFSGCIEEESTPLTPIATFTDDNDAGSRESGNDDDFSVTTTPVDALISTSSPLSDLVHSDYIQANGMVVVNPIDANLKSYITDQGISLPVTVHTYLFYRMDGLYLVITEDTDVNKEITSADVIGTLYGIDFDVPDVPDKLKSLQPKGVIVAESVGLSRPIQTTVKDINSNPSGYAFKRVKIQGIYLVTSYKIGYAEDDLQKHFGNGILADEFPSDDQSEVIETLDPVHTTWQVRQGGVIATVLYPTDEILDQFDYISPQGIDEVQNELRPALLVEEIEHKTIPDVSIQELTSNPYQYDGDVVKITGYALGENVPVKEILKQINQNMKYIPVDVNILGVGIADELNIGSQVILAGLNSELISETEMIMGRYEFEVAVTIQNVNAQDVPMLFLIEKKELPFEIPKNNTIMPTPAPAPKSGLLCVASSPSGANVYIDGTYEGATVTGFYQPFYVDAGSGFGTLLSNQLPYHT
ncbi:MAG: hypothetical protein U9N12_07300, partial [Euryarchaeota archaeon]|nr:hypothetical protein [Euryarchaeota archaeon]